MSLVADILQGASKVDLDVINRNIPNIRKDMNVLEKEVVEHVENVHVKYSQKSKLNNARLNELLRYQQTLEELKNKGELVLNTNLNNAEKELSNNMNDLKVTEYKLQVLLRVQTILKLLDKFNVDLGSSHYVNCVHSIKALNDIFEAISTDEYLEAFYTLKRAVAVKQKILIERLQTEFSDNIDLQHENNSTTTLRIRKQNEAMKNIIYALYCYSEYLEPLHHLARKMWEDIFIPIVNENLILAEKEDDMSVSLVLSSQSTEKTNYSIVFNNMEKVLKFLTVNFTYNISESKTALEYIGSDFNENLSELIVKNCLRDTIPSNVEELQRYNVIIDATDKLQKALLKSHIFTTQTASILEYVNNVDVLFIEKMCKGYSMKAKEIMKKDLHDITEVGVPYNPEYPLGCDENFSQCSISKNVEELLKLCVELLEKAAEASPDCSARLFTNVLNILSAYCGFVQDFHKAYLATLPQQIAVFLNNCLYIAYNLDKWDKLYSKQLVSVLEVGNFTVQANRISAQGREIFNKYIVAQVKQINEIMEGAELDVLALEKLSPKTEKCIRQCLRQQELLRTVWHKVLSYEIYNKNIGIIVNALCKHLITAIIKFEDIQANVSEKLIDLIKLILTRAPKLFIDANEITLYVPLWYKLNELSFVLNSSLVDINDRWASGKGPLALQFEPTELRGLIKALFQNTDRRAAVLARIC